MKKILSKKINGSTIIIATNDNGELKIGSQTQYKTKHMGAYTPFSNMWFAIDNDMLHVFEKNNELWCDIGSDLETTNATYPHLLFTEEETIMLRSIMVGK